MQELVLWTARNGLLEGRGQAVEGGAMALRGPSDIHVHRILRGLLYGEGWRGRWRTSLGQLTRERSIDHRPCLGPSPRAL